MGAGRSMGRMRKSMFPQSLEFHWRKAAVHWHRQRRSGRVMDSRVAFRYCSLSSSSASAIPGQGTVTTVAVVLGVRARAARDFRIDWLLSEANLRADTS